MYVDDFTFCLKKYSKALFFIHDTRNKYSVKDIKQKAINIIEENGMLKVEYLEIADESTLQPIQDWNESKHLRVFASVKAGNVRLIDNVGL